MTDQNIVISESVLKHYDVKLRDWVSDNINNAKTTSITKKFTILTSEWSNDKVTKDIEISEDYDILVSLPVGEQYIDNSVEAAASGITAIGHDGTNLIIKYLNRKPTTDIILQVTARKQGIALDVDGNIDLTDYAKKTDLPDVSALVTKEELNDKVDNYYTKAEVDDSFSQLDDEYIKSDDTSIVKLVNDNEINLQEDHNNAWFGYRDGKVNNWRFGNGTEGGLADVYANDYYLGDEKLSETYIRVDDTTIVKLVNDNEINLQEDHNNAWFGYRGGKVTNWKFGDGTEGGLADVYVKDLYLGDEKLSDLLGAKANDDDVVHKSGSESINGIKSFKDVIIRNVGNFAEGEAPTTQTSSVVLKHTNNDGTHSASAISSYMFTNGDTMCELSQSPCIGSQARTWFRTNTDGSYNIYSYTRNGSLGTSGYKWKNVYTDAINGINPGALSLPSTSVNVDTTDWVLDGSANSFTPTSDGWIGIQCTDTVYNQTHYVFVGRTGGGAAYYQQNTLSPINALWDNRYHGCVFFPVIKDMNYHIRCVCGVINAKFFPCQGNV